MDMSFKYFYTRRKWHEIDHLGQILASLYNNLNAKCHNWPITIKHPFWCSVLIWRNCILILKCP